MLTGFHQAGVVRVLLDVGHRANFDATPDFIGKSISVHFYKTYMPPRHLLNNQNVDIVDHMSNSESVIPGINKDCEQLKR